MLVRRRAVVHVLVRRYGGLYFSIVRLRGLVATNGPFLFGFAFLVHFSGTLGEGVAVFSDKSLLSMKLTVAERDAL